MFTVIMTLVAKNDEFQMLHKYYTTWRENPPKEKQPLISLYCKLIRIFYALINKRVEEEKKLNSRETVKRAIHMEGPNRVPLLFFNRDKKQSDIIMIDIVRHFIGDKKDMSEWGFKWERHDDTMGQPVEELIKEWKDLTNLVIPDAANKKRFSHVDDVMNKYGGKYYIASLGLTGFTIMSFLRGFENILVDIYENTQKVQELADIVFTFEENIIRQLKSYNFDAVAFFDDWGTQTNLILSPDKWREIFKPRYKKQFDLAHRCGLDVYFHCCGNIYEIIPDFIEIGVDMLNLSQPNIFDIENLRNEFGGKVCFVCPISYQTTAITGSKEDIYKEAKRLVDNLGSYNGGLIGYIEEYHSIGLSEDNYKHCIDAFRYYGEKCYEEK